MLICSHFSESKKSSGMAQWQLFLLYKHEATMLNLCTKYDSGFSSVWDSWRSNKVSSIFSALQSGMISALGLVHCSEVHCSSVGCSQMKSRYFTLKLKCNYSLERTATKNVRAHHHMFDPCYDCEKYNEKEHVQTP